MKPIEKNYLNRAHEEDFFFYCSHGDSSGDPTARERRHHTFLFTALQ